MEDGYSLHMIWCLLVCLLGLLLFWRWGWMLKSLFTNILLHSDLFEGQVEVGVCSVLPMEGITEKLWEDAFGLMLLHCLKWPQFNLGINLTRVQKTVQMLISYSICAVTHLLTCANPDDIVANSKKTNKASEACLSSGIHWSSGYIIRCVSNFQLVQWPSEHIWKHSDRLLVQSCLGETSAV